MVAEADRAKEAGGVGGVTGQGSSQVSTSVKPARSSRSAVSSAPAKFQGPSQPARYSAKGCSAPTAVAAAWKRSTLPAAAALRDQAAARAQRRVTAARTGRRGRPSSGRRRSRRRRRPARRAPARSGRPGRPWCAPPSASRACSTIEGAESTATTRPRGSRSSSSCVTRPEPQPASSTVSSPVSGSRSSTFRAHSTWGAETRS